MLFFEHPQAQLFVVLEDDSVLAMRSYAQMNERDTEAGGVLIGETRERSTTIQIATPPQSTDVRTRTKFNRKSKGHQDFVIKSWKESQGLSDYVGEWHTHPEPNPSPSWVDRVGWAKRSALGRRALVVVIVGQLSLYVGYQQGVTLTRLNPIN